MEQNSEHWIEVAVRNPILSSFVGAGLLISILMVTNDVRKRLFMDKPTAKEEPSSITQELRVIRDGYRELLRVQDILIDDLREDNADLREDNTDLRNALGKVQTQPIPDMRDNEGKPS